MKTREVNQGYIKLAENVSIRYANEIISSLESKYAKKFRGAKPKCGLYLSFGAYKSGKCDLRARFNNEVEQKEAVELFNLL